MEIHRSMRDECIVVALTGPINLFTAPRVQRALLKDLAERPYAIVCDLRGVDALDPVCATLFSTVANHPASDWPATVFLLCGAQPAVAAVLERLTVPHFLPLYDTLEEALDQVAARPPYLRDELRLGPVADRLGEIVPGAGGRRAGASPARVEIIVDALRHRP